MPSRRPVGHDASVLLRGAARRRPGALVLEGEADLLPLDLGIQDLVLQVVGGELLEEDAGALVLDHLVALGRRLHDRQLERGLAIGHRLGGDLEPALWHRRGPHDRVDGLGRFRGDGEHDGDHLSVGDASVLATYLVSHARNVDAASSCRRVVSRPQPSRSRRRSLLATNPPTSATWAAHASRRSTAGRASRQSGSLIQKRPCCHCRPRPVSTAARWDGRQWSGGRPGRRTSPRSAAWWPAVTAYGTSMTGAWRRPGGNLMPHPRFARDW